MSPKQLGETGILPSHTHHRAQGSVTQDAKLRMDFLSPALHVTEFKLMGSLPIRGVDDFSCVLMKVLCCRLGS